MFQQSFQGIIKSPPPLNFIFKGIFKMMMMMVVVVVMVVVVAQVAKLCVARWKPWSWTCAFRPTKHSVFWCLDTHWTSARANGGFAPKITPDMFLDYIIIIHHVIIYIYSISKISHHLIWIIPNARHLDQQRRTPNCCWVLSFPPALSSASAQVEGAAGPRRSEGGRRPPRWSKLHQSHRPKWSLALSQALKQADPPEFPVRGKKLIRFDMV